MVTFFVFTNSAVSLADQVLNFVGRPAQRRPSFLNIHGRVKIQLLLFPEGMSDYKASRSE
jgi:hypothetical protein